MKQSKKFAIGTIHENGGGKFEILDRYKENDTTILKYRFLDTGKIETNKEININASIWKFLKVRGLTQKQLEEKLAEKEEVFADVLVKLDGLENAINSINSNTEVIEELGKQVKELFKEVSEQKNVIGQLVDLLRIQQPQINRIIEDNLIIAKLVDKI